MSKWNVVRIGDHIKIKHGYAFEGEGISDVDNGKILVTPGNFDIGGGFKSNKFKFFSGSVPQEYILKAQELVVTMTDLSKEGDTLGYPAFIPANPRYAYLHNQRIGKIIFDDGAIDKGFLYYLFCTKEYRHEVLASATGTSIKHTSPKRIETFSTAVPSIAEQKAIASILGALDDKIKLNRRTNATLEAMARALFKSWFVDFDPVRAKSEGCHPFGMDAETAALFPSRLVPSDLGDIPEGWKVCRLEDAIAINPTTRLDKETVASYLDMFALPTSGFSPEKPILRKVSSGSRFQNGDTLLARITPCLENGKTAFVDCLETNQIGWGSTEFIVLRPRDPVPPAYGYLLARSEEFRAYAIQSMTGTSGRQRVPSEALVRYKIAVSSDLIYREFGNRVKGWFAVIGENARQNDVLEKTRDYLLPKLISGDIRIRDAKKFVEAA